MYFKMVSSFLCIFALFSLPSVLAISCYQCAPQPPDTMCTSANNTNITDCDILDKPPEGSYDACMKVTTEMSVGEQNLTMNSMSCMVKTMCETAKRDACNITDPGITIKKCEASCCFKDKCNGINGGSGSGGGTVIATSTPTSEGSSHVASFVSTFMSFTALGAHFFIH